MTRIVSWLRSSGACWNPHDSVAVPRVVETMEVPVSSFVVNADGKGEMSISSTVLGFAVTGDKDIGEVRGRFRSNSRRSPSRLSLRGRLFDSSEFIDEHAVAD
jgi:hypothetical protein